VQVVWLVCDLMTLGPEPGSLRRQKEKYTFPCEMIREVVFQESGTATEVSCSNAPLLPCGMRSHTCFIPLPTTGMQQRSGMIREGWLQLNQPVKLCTGKGHWILGVELEDKQIQEQAY
jgi:hypothetical protein